MDTPDRHNGQTDKQTNGRVSLQICLFVCVLDGPWRHKYSSKTQNKGKGKTKQTTVAYIQFVRHISPQNT